MTPPGASANNQQAEPTPHDLADAPEQPIPATREAALPESATQIAPSASRFEIVPAFSAIRTDLGLQSAISKMIAAQDLGLSKIISQQAALPKLSAVNIGNLAASLAVSSVNLRCPPVSGQGSNRISPRKGTGNVGGTEKVQSGI